MMEDGPFTIRNEELNLSTLNSKLSTLNFQLSTFNCPNTIGWSLNSWISYRI